MGRGPLKRPATWHDHGDKRDHRAPTGTNSVATWAKWWRLFYVQVRHKLPPRVAGQEDTKATQQKKLELSSPIFSLPSASPYRPRGVCGGVRDFSKCKGFQRASSTTPLASRFSVPACRCVPSSRLRRDPAGRRTGSHPVSALRKGKRDCKFLRSSPFVELLSLLGLGRAAETPKQNTTGAGRHF